MHHIAITYSEASYANYPVWVKGLDADIEIITLREDNFEEIKKCSGVVLSGGIDTHPKYYQRSRTNYPNAPETFNKQRDEFELKVFNWAQENKLPVLAICRGMQLVNVALGGTLIQDLEENNFANHRKMNGVDGMHQIATIPNSFVEAICKITSGAVNSAHHQGIDKIAPELTISAWSEDHVAEVIERKNNTDQPFFLGVQWHPERLALTQPDNPFTKNIRTYFIDSVKKQPSCKS